MLPVVIGLTWWWIEDRWRWQNLFRLAPLFMISALASGWTIWEQQFHTHAVGQEWSQSRIERLVIAGKAVWFYLGKLLWPHPLIFIYPRWEMDASHPLAGLPVLALGVTLIFLWLNRRGRLAPVFFAFVYFVISLFPILDFFNVYFFRYSFVGDHFQYLASLGPLALTAAGITTALNPLKRKAVSGTGVLRNAVADPRRADLAPMRDVHQYRNPLAHDAGKEPGLLDGPQQSGLLKDQGRMEEAVGQFRQALQINPNDGVALVSLGIALATKVQFDEAITNFRQALQINPNDGDALVGLESSSPPGGSSTKRLRTSARPS